MALYNIDNELFLGYSHSGAVIEEANSTVELTDEEVEKLINLIREKGTSKVKELGLEEIYPDLYEKLHEAYHDMAYEAAELHWLWHGYESGYFEYDMEELKEYCKAKCDFQFEYKESDYLDKDGNFDDDCFEDDENDAFVDWLDDYLQGLDSKSLKAFFYNQMHADLDLEDVGYNVEIPAAIIEKARK